MIEDGLGFRNQPISYEIIVRNIGPVPVFQVRVEDELPAGARYLGGDPQPELVGERLAWVVGALDPNVEACVDAVARAGGFRIPVEVG